MLLLVETVMMMATRETAPEMMKTTTSIELGEHENGSSTDKRQ